MNYVSVGVCVGCLMVHLYAGRIQFLFQSLAFSVDFEVWCMLLDTLCEKNPSSQRGIETDYKFRHYLSDRSSQRERERDGGGGNTIPQESDRWQGCKVKHT